MAKISASTNIDNIQIKEQGSAPTTPSDGYGRIYCKSGGLYYVGDNGTEIGPLAAATSAPAFSGAMLTKSAVQSIEGAEEVITFDGEVFDTDSYHDNSTNPSRLTAPATGYYMVGGSVELNGLADQKYMIVGIKKGGTSANGDGRARLYPSAASAAVPSAAFSRIVQLNASQYVELFVAHNNASAIDARESTNGTSFWIYKIA